MPALVELDEAWLTPRDTVDNVDSPAVWYGAGHHWVIATAKTGNRLLVHDAATGTPLRRVGGPGTGPGRFERPNGIAVVDDLALVVERDNHRVQVLRLPDFAPLGSFGDGLLRLPYGLAVEAGIGPGRYAVYVTDNYEMPDGSVPPDRLLGGRVRRFDLTVSGDRIAATPVRSFGDTAGPGVLRVVESIAADPTYDRLLIADESDGGSRIKVYHRDGRFSGSVIDAGLFPHQAEGIALYSCGDSAGYWVATDQDTAINTFHVFDRTNLAHLGSFRGRVTRNTDGIAIARDGFGSFPQGALFAVHDDGNVAAFSWATVAGALRLGRDCGPAAVQAVR